MVSTETGKPAGNGLRGFTHRVLIVAAVIVLFLFLWQILHALLFAFIGVLLAVLWRGLAGLVGRILPVSIRWSLLIVAVLGISLIALLAWFAGPRINDQLSQLTKTLPDSVNELKERLTQYSWSRYLVVQQLEGQFITPLVQKETVWLPPALVILAVVVFGQLFGVLGVLVATPLTAVVVVWVKMLYVEDVLGRRVEVG